MKFMRQFATGILIAELLLAVVLIVGLMVPLPGRVEFKIVQSGSMVPALPVGSMVTIVPEPAYVVGDIITFGRDAGKRIPTTHRIESIVRKDGGTQYVTKGDANEERDPEVVAHDQVIGKVVYMVPRLGYMLDFARSRRGFTYTVVIPAGLIILDELITIVATLRATRRARRDDVVVEEGGIVELPLEPAYVFAQPTQPARTQLSSIDGVRLVRRSPHAPRVSVQDRIRAGIDGYTVVLRAA